MCASEILTSARCSAVKKLLIIHVQTQDPNITFKRNNVKIIVLVD